MNPRHSQKRFSSLQVRALLVLVIVLSACSIIAYGIGIIPGEAQTSQQKSTNTAPGQEKKLENNLPRHLPLKVKVKNLNSKKWVNELEVEVTNTSDKPIYFLLFYIVMPEVKSPTGNKIAFRIQYGRFDFVEFSTAVKPDDVPIQPGETHTFKIEDMNVDEWEAFKTHEHQPEPKKIELVFSLLNFGDGTGYSDTSASLVDIHKRVSFYFPRHRR
jgi:hypothetical protein